jgi:DNA-binding ferritin-like protein (Dps family)
MIDAMKDSDLFELKTIDAPKYSNVGFRNIIAFFESNHASGQSLEDLISQRVGTDKTRYWGQMLEDEPEFSF